MRDLLHTLTTQPLSLIALSQQLKCSQQQILQQLQLFINQGIPVQQQGNEWYLSPLTPLIDPIQLQQQIPENPIIYQSVVNSTNQYILDNLDRLTTGSVCIAETQTAGRGRRNRVWQSPFAGQIILSYYQQFAKTLSLEGLSLVVSIAVIKALRQLGYHQPQLKWPNDLIVFDKTTHKTAKLGGILLEMSAKKPDFYDLVIGLGINVALPTDQQQQINQAITQLTALKPLAQDRTKILATIIQHLNQTLSQFTQSGFSPFITQWQDYDAYFGLPVKIIQENQTITGKNIGVNIQGQLCIKTPSEILTFHSGEVSLRTIDKTTPPLS
ncbi:biotin--[acetyl-CoA-carboxylase] ligase [Mergibacter septicus]|uniref:biotin--[biotin carboxyl-carrier protein] ligase n=1 Tax=Mergibacter septicus TaxID=221402 RepID=A0A8E3MHV4_9PAST|nr:bifunctional biotin--[acetyl-CoA-carboxylase] ligase/biotin operon repressor BirA [Mergibacter septicus]AWX16237.1 biotin--[acetyl-CoA-carboxylase] ligase [Mergibacter septicus]QDJ15489.1 biotin--[acetyl-CoA-carboxylase] ligase [Mergibacter septicus]UTU48641.1 bifunctional biotin--[acetyl-CoA-carboxylase] ligase/biotin operon repressor BirA [Mergibacter septicus]WMR95729.1 bifunctional biotin--[acetyl-CoA-carboxylase] ligase/biotin operon repressor BirA [Mergibacter septicus]